MPCATICQTQILHRTKMGFVTPIAANGSGGRWPARPIASRVARRWRATGWFKPEELTRRSPNEHKLWP